MKLHELVRSKTKKSLKRHIKVKQKTTDSTNQYNFYGDGTGDRVNRGLNYNLP